MDLTIDFFRLKGKFHSPLRLLKVVFNRIIQDC